MDRLAAMEAFVVIVEAGEDHHTRSSVDDPLVAAWYVMDR
jgi:hypothetical protein